LLGLIRKGNDLSVAVVPTAWDTYPLERKANEVREQLAVFEQWGFRTSVLELASADKSMVEKSLIDKSLVWVMGGNTFYLNYCMHKNGFSNVIRKFLDNGIVYGGESAGAVVAGSTLKGIDQVDDPKEATGVIWEGLGLTHKGIIPHWGWDKYATEIKSAKDVMAETTEIIMIDNDHAVIIEDEKERVVENSASK